MVITLDWERPWHLLRELKAWMGVLDALIASSVGEGAELQEGRERRELLFISAAPRSELIKRVSLPVESHLRNYSEPALPSDEPAAAPSTSHLPDMDAPLPSGTLLTNLGLSIVFVCTKVSRAGPRSGRRR